MRTSIEEVPFIGLASDLGGNRQGSAKGPSFLQQALGLVSFHEIYPPTQTKNCYETIALSNADLARAAYDYAKERKFFVSLGGDHSSAIGTWSGAAEGYRDEGDIGLIWIDAHMDSHVPETSPSGNVHGMPLAALLGYGNPQLTGILSSSPKLKPQNIALVGIRNYEEEEVALLTQLGVKIYFMEEIKQRGLEEVLKEALQHVAKHTVGYGISFDVDCLDPSFANAVGTPVPDGLDLEEFLRCFQLFKEKPPVAFELVEYNPDLDEELHTFGSIRRVLDEVCSFNSVTVS